MGPSRRCEKMYTREEPSRSARQIWLVTRRGEHCGEQERAPSAGCGRSTCASKCAGLLLRGEETTPWKSSGAGIPVSYTHLRAHETDSYL
eukprot:2601404-Pleurochrysis_carterae.AAC.1